MVLPGVGAMPKAMEAVRKLGLDELLHERVAAGVPVIGLCMGMQLLFESHHRARRGRPASGCSRVASKSCARAG